MSEVAHQRSVLVSLASLAVGVSYLILRIFQWVLSLPTIVGPDSHSFLPGPGLNAPPNWYFGFEKVSFTGDGVIRPWTVSLPYALLGADFVRSFVQMLLSAAAFLLLAWVVSRVFQSKAIGITLAFITLGISLTTLVTSWDMLLNRESIAISLTVFFLACALLGARSSSWSSFFATGVSGFLLTVTRPTMAPLTVFVLVATAVVFIRAIRKQRSMRKLVGLLLAFAFIVGTLAYPAWMSSRLDDSWTKWYGHTMSETQFGYVVSDYNPRAASLKEALQRAGAPICLTNALPVYTGEYVGAPWGFAAQMRESCPGFSEWYTENWPTWYYRYMLANPDYVAKLSLSGLPLALFPWDNGATTSLLPGSLRDLVFPVTIGPEQVGEYDPMFFYWGLVLACGVLWLVQRRKSIRQSTKENWPTVLLTASIVIGSVISIIANLLLIPSYPLETNRINVSTALTLRAVGVLLAVTLVWHFILSLQVKWNRRPNSAMKTGPGHREE